MRLVSTVVDRVGVCDEEVCGVDIDLRVTPLFDPSIPNPDASLVHF